MTHTERTDYYWLEGGVAVRITYSRAGVRGLVVDGHTVITEDQWSQIFRLLAAIDEDADEMVAP